LPRHSALIVVDEVRKLILLLVNVFVVHGSHAPRAQSFLFLLVLQPRCSHMNVNYITESYQ
jgi:hypothetical protein